MQVPAGSCQPVTYYLKSPPAPVGFPGSRNLAFRTPNISEVYALAAQADGRIIVGHQSGLARLNPDGSEDSEFAVNIAALTNYQVYNPLIATIALQPGGKILIAGVFAAVNGAPHPLIARLNPDGSIDQSFHSPFMESDLSSSLLYPRFWSAVVQPDEKVLIAGPFRSVGGGSQREVARLNTDGSLDPTFSPDLLFAPEDGRVNVIGLQSDQKVIVGTSYGMYRLNTNGSLDPTFGDGSGVDGKGVGGYFSGLALQSDGKLLMFQSLRNNFGVPEGLQRRNPNGLLDPTFDAQIQDSIGSCFGEKFVSTIAFNAHGKIMVAGEYGGVIRLNPDGSIDPGFDLGAGLNEPEWSSDARALVVLPDGDVIVAGVWNRETTWDPKYVVRLHGGEWPTILPRSITRLATGEFQCRASGPTNRVWTIQATTNLTAPTWTAIATNTLDSGSLTFTDRTPPQAPARYYRAVFIE